MPTIERISKEMAKLQACLSGGELCEALTDIMSDGCEDERSFIDRVKLVDRVVGT